MKQTAKLRIAIRLHFRAMRELHQVSPRFFLILMLSSIVRAVQPYITVFFSARVLSELAVLRRADVLWKWAIAGITCGCAAAIAKASLQRRFDTLSNDMRWRKQTLFARKLYAMDFADIDKQETHDLTEQIRQNENWNFWGLMKVPKICEMAFFSLSGLLSGVLLTYSLFASPVPKQAGWLTLLNHPGFILILSFVMVAISMLAGKLSAIVTSSWSSFSEQITEGNRFFGHFGFIGLNQKRSVDIRMYNQQNLVRTYWDRNLLFGIKGPIGRMMLGKMGLLNGLSACLATLITGSIYLFTCLKAWGGAFDVGMITQYAGAATAMTASITELSAMLGTLKTNAGYLEKVFSFLDIPNAMYQGSLTTEKRSDRQYEVEFRNVSFRYPGSEHWALRHVSMKFKVGKRLAIVGENGSGKTTFIKLLCRLYDPQEGQILLNGIDIRKYRYDDYMNIFSVVFQDFQLLAQPLGANVAGQADYDRERALKALQDAGFGKRLSEMEKGLDTMLYKQLDEDGVEISGGEAQKIAIARALYKDAPFIILDEPTAALDPIAEAEIYARFDEIAGDKTAVYISHRLSSCKFCDEIAVFHEGAVIQQGSHAELIADRTGKYYELWNAQAQYYAE